MADFWLPENSFVNGLTQQCYLDVNLKMPHRVYIIYKNHLEVSTSALNKIFAEGASNYTVPIVAKRFSRVDVLYR